MEIWVESANGLDMAETPAQLPSGEKWGIRAAAYLIDVIVWYAATYALQFLLGLAGVLVKSLGGQPLSLSAAPDRAVAVAVGLAANVGYFASVEWLAGATVGKLILGMRVVGTSGRPCTFGAAILRGMLRYVDGLFFTLPALLSMKEPLYQRLGDKAANTVVVRSRGTSLAEIRPWWMFLVAAAVFFAVDTALNLVLVLGMF